MAKEAKPETANVDAAPPKKSKKLLIIIAAAFVLVVALGATATLLLMKGQSADGHEEDEVATENDKASKKKSGKEIAPVYVALDAFTVNLVPESGEQFLQIVLSVEVADLLAGDRLKSFTPKIRNNVMMLLSGKKASELLTKEGKETLAGEIRDQMNEVLAPDAKSENAPVKEVLFTSFIIQ